MVVLGVTKERKTCYTGDAEGCAGVLKRETDLEGTNGMYEGSRPQAHLARRDDRSDKRREVKRGTIVIYRSSVRGLGGRGTK